MRGGVVALRGLLLLLAALCVLGTAEAWAKARVTDIRVGVHPEKTRFVIDLDGPVTFSVFSLADPYRIVIDLSEVDFVIPESRRRGGGQIAGLRFGLFEPGTSRIVLDASAPLSVAEAFAMPPGASGGHRLVLDLKRIDRARFLAESKASVDRRMSERSLARAETRPAAAVPVPVPVAPRRGASERRVIVIDAGHGGIDPGAIGVDGVYEKDIVLAAAKAIRQELEAGGRYAVVLTRDDDTFIRLRERVATARGAGGDLFMSLHADSMADKSMRGASVYTLSETASDAEAEALAAQENKSDIIAGMDLSGEAPDVASILIDLAQRETMNHSARFAEMLVEELQSGMKVLKRGHRFAGFAVLKAADVPSVLLEMGYLSNRTDEKLLTSPEHRQRVAKAVRRTIDRYFEQVQSAAR